jgi:hypothetical protein
MWTMCNDTLKSMVANGACFWHYKKPVFFVMFKKTQETFQKNKDDVHETSPKIGSTETCKKHGKICTQHGQCLP